MCKRSSKISEEKVPYNSKSKDEDRKLYEASDDVLKYALENISLPKKYRFEKWNSVPFELMNQWFENRGVPFSERTYLLNENKCGKFSSIEPDGGIIVAVQKDSSGNIKHWVPLLATEAKHQDSGTGNAIERFFKNFNAVKELYFMEKIFPYVGFGQGDGLDTEFEKNKIRVGMGNDTNKEVNINDRVVKLINGETYSRKNGIFQIQKTPWTKEEMYGRLLTAFLQSYKYFFEGDNPRYLPLK